MKEFIEHIKGFWFVYGILAAAAVWIATINSKTFDTPEQKVEHINHVEGSPTPEQRLRRYLIDSLDKQNAMRSRSRRDSMYRVLINRMNYSDSIQLLNADQMYQIKEQLKNEN